MKATLHCKACGATLSSPVALPEARDPNEAGIDWTMGKTLTPRGEAFVSTRPMQWSHDPKHKPPLEFSPQCWLNPDDVGDAVEMVANGCRLNGCCGLDGSNGPNMRCGACKNEVGTRQNDCWTSDVFIPQPDATTWKVLEQ